MYSEDDLDHAVQAGVLKQHDVDAFRNHVANSSNTTMVDEENFRFLTGFNDIFVVISSLLLLCSATYITAQNSLWGGALVLMGLSWCLAEYFTKLRKLSLPSIVLVVSFLGGSVWLGFLLTESLLADSSWPVLTSGLFGAVMAIVHWRRFGVPITPACVLATFSYGIVGAALAEWGEYDHLVGSLALVMGLFILAIAIFWDADDRYRKTKKSDTAFWLHLCAAPLIVHAAFSLLSIFEAEAQLQTLLIVMALYVFLAVISLVLDRRALMVSSLFYVLYVFTAYFNDHGYIASGFAVTGVAAGIGLLTLSAFWHQVRQSIVKRLPDRLQLFLPAIS